METYFVIRSQTYAEKAQQLLSRYRFSYNVTRITGAEGCAYRFRTSAPAQEIFGLLGANGIPWQQDTA